jgi:hypothetical protein
MRRDDLKTIDLNTISENRLIAELVALYSSELYYNSDYHAFYLATIEILIKSLQFKIPELKRKANGASIYYDSFVRYMYEFSLNSSYAKPLVGFWSLELARYNYPLYRE